MPSLDDKSPLESSDTRIVAMIRCALAMTVALLFPLASQTRTRFSKLSYLILGLYVTHAALYHGAQDVSSWWQQQPKGHTYDVRLWRRRVASNERGNKLLAATLVTVAFVIMPRHYHRQAISQLCLIRWWPFDPSDMDSLRQVLEYIICTIYRIHLVDQLASGAAQVERRRIGHNFHESVIQPYVSLCIGWQAIQRKLAAGGANAMGDLQQSLDLTNKQINELRP